MMNVGSYLFQVDVCSHSQMWLFDAGKLVWGNQVDATCELRTQTLGLFKQSHSVFCAFVAIVWTITC